MTPRIDMVRFPRENGDAIVIFADKRRVSIPRDTGMQIMTGNEEAIQIALDKLVEKGDEEE
tara:strand:- start:10456 stop:10638 length:183 start_codon:yes stop_codon:yes gene_type:complete